MKPTRFSDELPSSGRTDGEQMLARVLPRRCDGCHGTGVWTETAWSLVDTMTDPEPCEEGCDGAGFLYPDPPDWWDLDWYEPDWDGFCELVWRVLGIVDTE